MNGLLFVYGTLMRASGHPKARRLALQSAYIGRARMNGQLFHLGRYPGAILSKHSGNIVHGDLLRLFQPDATLAWLDEYEGCAENQPQPHPYKRAIVDVSLANGGWYKAWGYVYELPVRCARILPDGRFSSRQFY